MERHPYPDDYDASGKTLPAGRVGLQSGSAPSLAPVSREDSVPVLNRSGDYQRHIRLATGIQPSASRRSPPRWGCPGDADELPALPAIGWLSDATAQGIPRGGPGRPYGDQGSYLSRPAADATSIRSLQRQSAAVRGGFGARWVVRVGGLLRTDQAQAFIADFRDETGGMLQLALRLFPDEDYLGAIVTPCPEIEGPR